VGAANGSNPIAIAVPCHRVIGADGTLTGYAGGLERKRFLLAHEGAAARSGAGSAANAGRAMVRPVAVRA
jgi:methylated-DNA-[protein]-cysteine S-methyltransferase